LGEVVISYPINRAGFIYPAKYAQAVINSELAGIREGSEQSFHQLEAKGCEGNHFGVSAWDFPEVNNTRECRRDDLAWFGWVY
jgi:hypothetical protein